MGGEKCECVEVPIVARGVVFPIFRLRVRREEHVYAVQRFLFQSLVVQIR